jgi:hypothetical protein
MKNIQDYLKLIDYNIKEGSLYLWDCFGKHNFNVVSNVQGNWHFDLVYSLKTLEVHQVSISDYKEDITYTFFPSGKEKEYREEFALKELDTSVLDTDIVLETEDDFFEKAFAIINGKEYDKRIKVPLNVSEKLLFHGLLEAHSQDITFNEYVCKLIKNGIEGIPNETPVN